ncbi:MAG: COP23 domain-containing protein [Chroococcidiopsidaceae cyanobacterium CP_BM_ER_R8_30]|nr:COP23 domain-containing protein [Chroococcidiopsidaceae cyanobacterium CP_BM_ER_R8_30]
MIIAKFTCPTLVTALIFSGATAVPTAAQTSLAALATGTTPSTSHLISTTFRCVRDHTSFVTIAQRGDRITPPVITWNSTLGNYSPQERCQLVSQKLTAVVAQNAGKLSNLVLLAGFVNRQSVICVVNDVQPTCNRSNVLFTLRPENATRPDEVLARLHNFSVSGNGASVLESGSLDSLPLEGLNRFLGPEDGSDSTTSSPNSTPTP